MSYHRKAVTYDQLIDMLKAMRDADNIDSIYVEECYGGSLEIFVHGKHEEKVSKWDEDRINASRRSMGWVAEDYPEATEEQKANLVKLFREV